EERGGGDAVASLTTSDDEIARNRHQPEGLRATRRIPDFFTASEERAFATRRPSDRRIGSA
ncbi:MAG TPA: hypothetical protein VIL97_09630, partial [Thermoanaerobaculia bacterium]